MKRRPETRRKIPTYFAGTDKVELDWSHVLELDWSHVRGCWQVQLWSEQLHRWYWESLQTTRVGKKLEAEAKAAAIKLLRAEVERCEAQLAKIAAQAKQLSIAAERIESGRMDWSAL